MSTKDFKQGMVAGAKPFGDKLDQLANVSESAVSDLKEGLDGIADVTYALIDDVESHDSTLSAYEKKRIYDLDDATDISALEDDEKEFLIAVLTELANALADVSDLQKKYLLSVCSVANIPAAQTSLNLACIENVENMKTQKILLRHVMEFLFVGEQDYDFLDRYEDDLFCYFSVNKRGIAEIKDTINRVYNAMGIEGIANRYTFTANYHEICAEQETSEYGEDRVSVEMSAEENQVSNEEIERLEKEAEKLYLEFKIEEALAIFNQLVELKHPRAMYFASEIYANGFGIVTPDKEKAVALRKLGCEQGCCLCFPNSTFTEASRIQSIIPALTTAAQQGDLFAQYELASVYNQGHIVERNTDTALMWLNRSSGYWRSKFALGYYYYTATSVPKNQSKALEYWGEVAELGYPQACHNFYTISVSLKEGTFSSLNIKRMVFLNKAVAAKLTFALYAKANYLYNAPFYTKEQKIEYQTEAKELLRQAAEQGYEDAIKKFNRLQAGKKISIFSWNTPGYSWNETIATF